ncbi:CLUMA_CG012864, isoform B [Clunio marinus]|uniref:CLUMA_CG012864, isoform B n=1 Tax=Clunio marinus TaxID=568069 RepID=A0A1J1IIF8_9DIPT|nr:CLUMA_CG012864, isoform B [Clunio marinus]
MASQRFCLRWNNHQSNLLSVFDQLLHAETFTDVTLAIDGQYLKAHKMVLSACSPYFQALFVNHPEKHPIVILKDIPFADMKSLLDFMYRGEVSVDQERLSAFLRVAESLRIKGLTEVNEDKPSTEDQIEGSPSITQNRIHPYVLQQQQQQRKVLQQQQKQSSQQIQSQPSNNPLLGSALSMPKRKRGRPRKLSGSDDVDDYDDDCRDGSQQDAQELMETKIRSENDGNSDENDVSRGIENNEESNNRLSSQSKRTSVRHAHDHSSGSTKREDSTNDLFIVPKKEPIEVDDEEVNIFPEDSSQNRITGHVKTQASSSSENLELTSQQQQQKYHINAIESNGKHETDEVTCENIHKLENERTDSNFPASFSNTSSTSDNKNLSYKSPSSLLPSISLGGSQKSFRRRIRRKHNSPDDQAEALTEMSVRGLNLFRYASIQDGIYKCTECAKENVQKTFKNKYSFQRHAFLYHEGTQRKVFPCPVCRKEFSRPDKMKNHMKMTHDCYMPKECKYPLPLLIAGSSQTAQITQPVNNSILNLATSQ